MRRHSDFNGNGRHEIPVMSPWGLGLLEVADSALHTRVIASNGTRFAGGWLLNTADNRFDLIADLDADAHAELVVSSPWGVGVLERAGSRMRTVMLAPNGTRFGGWLLNTVDNRLGPSGDFDGDGQEELLVTSPWGVGVWKLSGSTFEVPMMAPNGTRFGGWLLNTADNRFGPVADFDGDGRDELVVSSPWGMAILNINGSSVSPLVMAANGTRFPRGWLLNTADNRIGIGPEAVRLHLKVLEDPTISIGDMTTEMRRVFAQAGIHVHVVSTEQLDLDTAMLDVDVGSCVLGSVTSEQATLFSNRDNAPTTDVVIYFVRSTVPAFNGCAAHPADLPGAVVARGASRWTMGHEVGHVLDLRHVTDSDRLMTGGGTANITNPPPDISPDEANTAKASLLTHPL